MMRILALVSSGPHSHDYGCDFLLDGFREACGADNVVDWPPKPCLHLQPGRPRDECNIDSDAWWPVPEAASQPIGDLVTWADLVVLAMSLEDAHACEQSLIVCHFVPETTPIIGLDYHDSVMDRRSSYERIARRPVLYFRRELPIGADWGFPCPMTYPASRVPDPMPQKFPRVVYHATHHGDQPPGVPRFTIVNGLRRHLQIPRTALDVALYPSQQNRPSPEAYHDKMARGLIGIHWNGAANYCANRLWENFAFGLCNVIERPRIQIPNVPEHLKHCYYVDRPEDVAPAVAMLLNAPKWALSIAESGHQHFLKYHCSRARAQYVLDTVAAHG